MDNYWKDKNVLVTGCTGFLGSWISKGLVEKGANVVGIVRDVVPGSYLYSSGTYKKMNLVNGSIEDPKLLERTILEYFVDTVFHIAAQSQVRTANKSPIGTFKTNVEGTWNLLEACRLAGGNVKRILIASSDKVYGNTNGKPYSEELPLLGLYPYDASKVLTDVIAQSYAKTYNMPIAITRFCNIYGGGDLNFDRIVPQTIKSIFLDQDIIIRSDGKSTRDYIYVEDVVDGYFLLAQKLDEGKINGEYFNFSSEEPVSVSFVVDELISASGKKNVKKVILNQAPNEIPHQTLLSNKAKKILGWAGPKHSMKEGIKKTVDWYMDYLSKKF